MFEMQPYRKNNLLRRDEFDPIREMDDLERAFFGEPLFAKNRFFDNVSLERFKTDIKDEGDKFVLLADLPGFDKKDINVNISGNCLTINAERHLESEEKDKRGKFIRRERTYGNYSRNYDISEVAEDKITAKYDNGVLTLILPKKEDSKSADRTLKID